MADAIRFRRSVDRLVKAASRNARAHAEKLLASFDPDMSEEKWTALREAVIQTFLGDVNLGSDAVGALAANFYDLCTDGIANAGKGAVDGLSRITPEQAEGTVRRLAGRLFRTNAQGERLPPDKRGFLEGIESYASKRSRESANETIERCVQRSPNKEMRYQRVPTGSETCTFCAMLASRGAVYRTAATAGKASHNNCRCVAMPAPKGQSVEGCPKKDWLKVWERFQEIDDIGLGEEEAKALKMVSLSRMKPAGRAPSTTDITSALGNAISKAESDFKKLRVNEYAKDKEAYQATIGRFISELGHQTSSKLVCQFEKSKKGKFVGVVPSAEELRAAISIADGRRIEFMVPENGSKPDLLVAGQYMDIKTPSSLQKVTDRLAKAAKQLKAVGIQHGEAILDITALGDDKAEAEAIAQRFVEDGALTQITVLDWPDKWLLNKK